MTTQNGTPFDRKMFGRVASSLQQNNVSRGVVKDAGLCADAVDALVQSGKFVENADPLAVKLLQRAVQRAKQLSTVPDITFTAAHMSVLMGGMRDLQKQSLMQLAAIARFANYVCSTDPEFLRRSR